MKKTLTILLLLTVFIPGIISASERGFSKEKNSFSVFLNTRIEKITSFFKNIKEPRYVEEESNVSDFKVVFDTEKGALVYPSSETVNEIVKEDIKLPEENIVKPIAVPTITPSVVAPLSPVKIPAVKQPVKVPETHPIIRQPVTTAPPVVKDPVIQAPIKEPTTDGKINEDMQIMYWWGKVNRHLENSDWKTDPDGVSGANLDMLTYCKKWYPNSVGIKENKLVTIDGWKDRGNLSEYTTTKMSYYCLQK